MHTEPETELDDESELYVADTRPHLCPCCGERLMGPPEEYVCPQQPLSVAA